MQATLQIASIFIIGINKKTKVLCTPYISIASPIVQACFYSFFIRVFQFTANNLIIDSAEV